MSEFIVDLAPYLKKRKAEIGREIERLSREGFRVIRSRGVLVDVMPEVDEKERERIISLAEEYSYLSTVIDRFRDQNQQVREMGQASL